MEFESRHDIRARTNMRPKFITDPGCQTCEFDLNFDQPKFEPKYNIEPTELSDQEKDQVSAQLDALDFDPTSCAGEECWQDFPDQTDNGMRSVSPDSQDIDEGLLDKFKKQT